MQRHIRTGIRNALIAACFFTSLTTIATPGYAAVGGVSTGCPQDGKATGASGCQKAQADGIRATHIFQAYCDIVPQRDLGGVPLDPTLTEKQAIQFRIDSYNDTEKKLAAMRQKLMKLDHAAVESMLHKQMEKQGPDDTRNLMCAMEIVARMLPQEFDDYRKLIKPGVDELGYVDDIRGDFLGKNAALHKDPDPTQD